MKTKILTASLVTVMSFVLCAGEVPHQITGWKLSNQDTYQCNVKAESWGAFLKIQFEAVKSTMYRLDFTAQANPDKNAQLFWKIKKGQKEYTEAKLNISGKPQSYSLFAYAEEDGPLSFGCFSEKDNKRKDFIISNIKISEVNMASDNLFPATALQNVNMWSTNNKGNIKLVNSSFMGTSKSLEISGKMFPAWFPIVPGKKCKLTFWAKSTSPQVVDVTMDAWRPTHQGKHFWFGKKFKISTEWQQFSLEKEVPLPSEYPDLTDHLIRLAFKQDKTEVPFDINDIEFKEISK